MANSLQFRDFAGSPRVHVEFSPRLWRGLANRVMVQPHGVRIAALARLKYDPQFGGDIMKRILCLAVATIAICLITTSAQAQSRSLKLRFNIPFSFTVRNTTFPAGEYEITEPSHWFLELRNLKNKVAGFEHVQSAQSRDEADGRVRLIFHQYDNEYFLAVVSDGSWQSTYDIQTSKVEKRLADASPNKQLKVVSVLVNGTVQTGAVGQK